MNKKFDIFYFSSTHWDREWYQDFNGFRYRLVKMINGLLDVLQKNGEYKTFHFDGQTIVLDDYVEICPEKKELLEKYIADKKILTGPWYVMPDEFLVSGESLIRNLMIGHKKAKKWGGEPWKYGYICDIFGHIAQMPQIFNGFSIKYSLLGRGTKESDPMYFVWRSPDGSECINFKLSPDDGYGEFTISVYDNEKDRSINNPKIVENIKAFVEKELERSNVPVVIAMDGLDHREVCPHTTDYIKLLKELYPQANVHHVNLCEQGKLLEKYRDELPVMEGELNKTAKYPHVYLHLITNTLSSYYSVKKQNDECQNMLEKTLEPLIYLAKMQGVDLNRSYVEYAYENLIRNHPHDSICGCSVDQVHKDMDYRFAQVYETGKSLKEDFLYSVRRNNVDNEHTEDILTLYNTLPFEVDKTVSVNLLFKPDYKYTYNEPFGYEEINAFKIYDFNGNEISYQITDIRRKYTVREYAGIFNPYDLHKVTMRVKVPAMGVSEYKIVPVNHPVRYFNKLKSGKNYAENEYVRMNILSNGNIEIEDKKTGRIYTDLLSLADDGEIGDGWYHANPVNDFTVYSDSLSALVEKTENAPSKASFRITRYMEVPREIPREDADTFRSKHRSLDKAFLKIVTTVSLCEESRHLDVKMTVENTAKDHRLKLLLPTGIDCEEYFSGQAFYCVTRKTGRDNETETWMEPAQYEKATNGIVGKRDEKGCGLAFISKNGLHECAAIDDEDGTLEITLLRAFRTTPLTNGEENCQLNKTLEYEFAVLPVDNEVTYKDMVKLQDVMACGLLEKFENVQEGTPLEAPRSFLEISGENIIPSIVKYAENKDNAIVMRVYNGSGEKSKGKITIANNILKAEAVNLNEEYLRDVHYEKNCVEFEAEPWKILTFKLYL